jgi:hypothetical protein
MSFVNFCLSVPNLDTLIFYLIFVILIPGYLFYVDDYETLKYYLPMLIMMAVTLTTAGAPDMFVNLYPNSCDPNLTFAGFLSTNIINSLAVIGILAQATVIAVATSSITLGLVSGLITFAIAFPIAQTILPFFIIEGDLTLRRDIFQDRVLFPGNWHMYFLGLIFAILFIGVQYILMVGFTRYILSTGTKFV